MGLAQARPNKTTPTIGMCGEYTIEREWFYVLWRDLFVHTVTLQNIKGYFNQ